VGGRAPQRAPWSFVAGSYQLSVTHKRLILLAVPRGFEPPTIGIDNVELESVPREDSGVPADLRDAAFADAPAAHGDRHCILCMRIADDEGKKRGPQHGDV